MTSCWCFFPKSARKGGAQMREVIPLHVDNGITMLRFYLKFRDSGLQTVDLCSMPLPASRPLPSFLSLQVTGSWRGPSPLSVVDYCTFSTAHLSCSIWSSQAVQVQWAALLF